MPPLLRVLIVDDDEKIREELAQEIRRRKRSIQVDACSINDMDADLKQLDKIAQADEQMWFSTGAMNVEAANLINKVRADVYLLDIWNRYSVGPRSLAGDDIGRSLNIYFPNSLFLMMSGYLGEDGQPTEREDSKLIQTITHDQFYYRRFSKLAPLKRDDWEGSPYPYQFIAAQTCDVIDEVHAEELAWFDTDHLHLVPLFTDKNYPEAKDKEGFLRPFSFEPSGFCSVVQKVIYYFRATNWAKSLNVTKRSDRKHKTLTTLVFARCGGTPLQLQAQETNALSELFRLKSDDDRRSRIPRAVTWAISSKTGKKCFDSVALNFRSGAFPVVTPAPSLVEHPDMGELRIASNNFFGTSHERLGGLQVKRKNRSIRIETPPHSGPEYVLDQFPSLQIHYESYPVVASSLSWYLTDRLEEVGILAPASSSPGTGSSRSSSPPSV